MTDRRFVYETLVVILVLVVIFALLSGWRDCRSRGGAYVRGLFWMECIRR